MTEDNKKGNIKDEMERASSAIDAAKVSEELSDKIKNYLREKGYF